MSIIAFGNNKGGAGKSTVTVQCAASLALRGKRVLVADLDPQANASRRLGFRWERENPVPTISEAIKSGESGIAVEAIVQSSWEGELGRRVDLLPSRYDLESRIGEAGQVGAVRRLSRVLEGVDRNYDFVLFDLPPSLGHLTHMGLAAAQHAVCVVEPEYDSVEGATRYRDFIEAYREDLGNPGLRFGGVIVSRLRPSLGEHAYQLEGIKETFAGLVWEPPIQERTVLKDASTAAMPVQQLSGTPAREVAMVFDHLAANIEKMGV